jgi:menaquinone-dependent protoporphyrinogen oxidase
MCEVPVFYATTEGQTKRIADRIAERLREHGLDSRAMAIASDETAAIDWNRVRGAVVGASLHMRKHQAEAVSFARLHNRVLSAIPAVFVSVSLAAASMNADSVAAARQLAEKFAVDTGWRPLRISSLAGRLAYTQYPWLVRLVMRHIARKEGGSTDTSRDHEYTNWESVEHLADLLASELQQPGNAAASHAELRPSA